MSDSENTYTTYITHISITCIADISYIIFQAYEKTVKYFLKFFFLYIKMTSNVIKNTTKISKKKQQKDIKMFLKKKKTKGKKGPEKDIKILLKKTKKEASIFSRT